MTVGGSVRRTTRLLGETITIAPGAKLDGATTIAGHTVSVAGQLGGDLRVAAHDVSLDGAVSGDVDAAAERIDVGPNARIGGRLRYRGDHAPVVADGAQIAGSVEHEAARYERFSWSDDGHRFSSRGFGRGTWFGASLVIGVLMLLIGPAFMADTSSIARRAWAQSLGVGFMTLITVPVAILVLFITLIGIPVGLLGIALYATVIIVGYEGGAVAIGDLAVDRLAPARVAHLGPRILALLVACCCCWRCSATCD